MGRMITAGARLGRARAKRSIINERANDRRKLLDQIQSLKVENQELVEALGSFRYPLNQHRKEHPTCGWDFKAGSERIDGILTKHKKEDV